MEITQSQIDSMANAVVAIRQQLTGMTVDTMNAAIIEIQSQLDPIVNVIAAFGNAIPVLTTSADTVAIETPVADTTLTTPSIDTTPTP